MRRENPYHAWLAAVDGQAGFVTGPGRGWAGNRVLLADPGSTNSLARRVVDEYLREEMALPAAVFVAWEQTGGKGRHGRAWVSAPGAGAWVSMIRPQAGPGDLATLPLLVPLGLCDALDPHLPEERPCRIKWPNDLVVGGRKIGGVLIDGVAPRADERGTGAAVIGFGVNLLQEGAELAAIGGAAAGGEGVSTGRRAPTASLAATSLAAESGGAVAAEELVWELVAAVAQRLTGVGDTAAAVAAYAERSAHRPGDALRCRTGEETLEGRYRGLDERGFLRLELTAPGAGRGAGDEVLMRAGEVVE